MYVYICKTPTKQYFIINFRKFRIIYSDSVETRAQSNDFESI